MKTLSTSLGLLGALVVACTSAAAQTGGNEKPTTEQTPVSGWRASCAAADRTAPLDCALEQRAFVAQSGQLLVAVTLRVDGAERKPALMIQTPIGLFLPAGVTMRVDDGQPESLVVQTCDAAGCYAGTALGDTLLARMAGGRQLSVGFQDLAKRDVSVSMPLDGFAKGWKKIR